MRRFVGKNSAGLRVRTNPSLQSEQIGIVKPDGIISFMDEVCSFLKSLKHYAYFRDGDSQLFVLCLLWNFKYFTGLKHFLPVMA